MDHELLEFWNAIQTRHLSGGLEGLASQKMNKQDNLNYNPQVCKHFLFQSEYKTQAFIRSVPNSKVW